MHFLFSLILLHDEDIESALDEVNKARKLFEENKSTSGLAKCFLLESYLTYKEFSENLDSSSQNDNAKIIDDKTQSNYFYMLLF